jgi:phage terminase large subunit GpA-like protein
MEARRKWTMTSKLNASRLNRAIHNALVAMEPPDDLTVTEWAEKKRRLSSEASAEPGAWRTERTPYLREPMNAFTDPRVKRIVMVAASQVGKSEFINNCIGYIIDEDPGSILFVHPTGVDAKEYSKLRIAPMIRDCPTLRKRVSDPKSRDSGNTILQKTYPGGILTMCGSTEAHSLASKPIRYVLGDERDRWASSAGNEGDPWDLAMARQTTFYNAKAVEVSTPTVKGASAIEASFADGTMERWKTQCPHCGGWHEIRFQDIRYEHEEKIIAGKKTFKVLRVMYVCPECACISDEHTMKNQPARWEAENPDAYANGCRSFWLNAFVSAWASWESIILKYLRAIGSTKKLQVVYNTAFGELWEDCGDVQDEDSMLKRREEYKAELPEGVLVLTAGVDTQDDRLEYEIVGHGHFGETWGIQKGVIMGRPDDGATWRALDDVLNKVYHYEDGLGLRVSMTFVDEGGHFTQSVREQCHRRIGRKVFDIKGFYGSERPFTAPPKKQKIVVNNKSVGTCWQYQIGVDAGKQIIFDNLTVQTPGPRYCHFPARDDYGPQYFNGLLSEHLVYDPDRKQPWQWDKIPGHERNEPLDCRNYAMAAFKVLPVNLDAVDRRLKEARGEKPVSVAILAPAAAHGGKQRKQGSRAVDDQYDNW